MPPSVTKKQAFVSYRHESEAHRKAVLAFCHRLAATLQDEGVELVNDQVLLETLPAGPDEGWNRWSMNMAAHADHVIAVVSPGWFAAMDQKELKPPPGGQGSAVEATVIFNRHTHGRTISPWLRLVRLPTYPETETNWLFRDIPIFLGENDDHIRSLSRWIKGVDNPGGTAQPPPAGTPPPRPVGSSPDAGSGRPRLGMAGDPLSDRRPVRSPWAFRAIVLTALAGAAALGAFLIQNAKKGGERHEAPAAPASPEKPPHGDSASTPQAAPSAPPEAPEAGSLWAMPVTADCTLRFRWCPPGTFTMGRTPAEFDHLADFDLADQPRERTRTEVTIRDGFWIAETELTLHQLSQIRGFGAPETGNLPATGITHAEARQICDDLSRRTSPVGVLARLPTEGEWEYACRAGSVEIFSFGERIDSSLANFDTETPMPGTTRRLAKKKAVAVGSYRPNNWTIFDMHGNVSEWCGVMSGSGAAAEETTGVQPGHFPARGGHWNSYWIGCTSGAKNYQDGTLATAMTGVRLVLSKRQQP